MRRSASAGKALPSAPLERRAFSAEQLQNLRDVFNVLDEDGSGIITAHELYAVLRKLDPTATIEAAEAMIAEVDVDGDQEIHFEEFKVMMEARLNQAPGVDDMIRLLDVDNDGVLSRLEVRDALRRVGMLVSEDDVDEMLRVCDRADKGHVTAADLAAMFAEAGVFGAAAEPASLREQRVSVASSAGGRRTGGRFGNTQ